MASDPSVPVMAAPPGRPAKPAVQVTAVGTVTVSWTVPSSGPLDNYSVTSDPAVDPPAGCTTADNSCVFTNLNPATSYTFQVESHGPLGDALSTASVAVVPNVAGEPGTPTVVLTAVGQAMVSWAAPTSGGAVTGYTLTSNYPNDMTVPQGCGDRPMTMSCLVTGLDKTKSYMFQVVAHGPGSPTSSAMSVAVVPDKPGIPQRPTAVAGAPGSATVSWAAPLVGAGPIDGYSVVSDPPIAAPDSCTLKKVFTCVFTGLSTTGSYTFVVTAHGPLGDTDSQRSSSPVTPAAPGVPGTPKVQVTGPTTVHVSWTASQPDAVLTDYSVTSDPVVTPAQSCTGTTARECDFTGLNPSTSYTFLVTANGPAGHTPSVARSAAVTPGALPAPVAPGIPGTPTAQFLAANTVTVTWGAASGDVTKYTVTSSADPMSAQACTDVVGLTCTFGGLVGASYTFRVRAYGPGGDTVSSWSTAITAAGPGVPAAPQVNLSGANAVQVSWTAPTVGGPISKYSVVSTPARTAPNECTNISGTTCVFNNLLAGTSYTFAVVATGSVVGTTTSPQSAAIITGPPEVPGKPTVALTPVNTEVTVSWVTPGRGAGISSFTVLSSQGAHGCNSVAGPSATSCVVSGLDPVTSYTFKVQAVGVGNSGTSQFSPDSDAIFPGTLASPINVDVAVANRSIVVVWPASTGAGLASYEVRSNPGTGLCRAPIGPNPECVISGLTNGTSYTVSVVAVATNTALNSAPSAPSARVRPTAGVPGVPTGVRAAPIDGGTVVSWTAPAWVGDGITSYLVTATGGVDEVQTCSSASALSCPISGLTNGTDYQVTVVAIGRFASGASASSVPVIVRPRNAPAAPTGVVVTPLASALRVAFVPGNVGAGVASYTATAVGGPSSSTCNVLGAAATTCDITGVTPGAVYTVTVVANGIVNGGGNSAPSTASDAVKAVAYPAPLLPQALPTGSAIFGTVTLSGPAVLNSSVTVSGAAAYAPFTAIAVGIYTGSVLTARLATTITDANGAFSLPVLITGVTAGTPRTILAAGMRTATSVRYQSLTVTVAAPVNVVGHPAVAAAARTASLGALPVADLRSRREAVAATR
jgi:hypothetical protein